QAGFAIVGYGKLGGLELGYGSDLDLVFVHDSAGSKTETDGERPLDNAVFFGRLTRRIIHVLTLSTPSGRMYEVDTRLRPSGGSGLLVSSLTALERYQREDAWTWEHQALLRSRAVAGDQTVRDAFEALRRRILVESVHRDSLKQDVSAMRERMRSELSKGTARLFDLKQDPGGIADIEFIVQYLVLEHAREHPELVVYSDNIRQLEALARCTILSGDEARQLSDTYRQYRAIVHRLSLAGEPALVPKAEVADLAARIIAFWESVFE
ncbi:MAG TPA: bifunctional glutamine synthetase adenylyltransferase/deadenyltransferase, partial [Chromatiales bacterium]|nr:bifunctional glutamine synthetase adenylyltransferase/deadenyltransferase [Chromatiales bacterium]